MVACCRKSHGQLWKGFRAGVPSLLDLMTDDLRWSCCNNSRGRVHRKCDVVELSRNHPPLLVRSMERPSSVKLDPGAHKVGDLCPR